MFLLLLWIFINIFRHPPSNPLGFLRFSGGNYYVAAWYPLLLFYFGSKIASWSQIWHYALKFNKLFVVFSPVIVFLFIKNAIYWSPLLLAQYLVPILILNWEMMQKNDKTYVIISLFVCFFLAIFGGSRSITFRMLFYVPVLYVLMLIKQKSRSIFPFFIMSILLIGLYFLGSFIYEGGLNSTTITNPETGAYKFSSKGFSNSREDYAYPDFFLDMKSMQDWALGRGINGSYYSKIFETDVDKDLNEKNSLGVKKGYRENIECGYLEVILKIGLIGLILKLMLALPAIYLGLFKSNNWFVKSCAIIIIEWLIAMYPAALPEFIDSYMLVWLCIGACLSKETRNAHSSTLFLSNLKQIQNKNKSFIRINHF
jgi:hypothetical protein